MRQRGEVSRRTLLQRMLGGGALLLLAGCGGKKKSQAAPTRGVKVTVAPELAAPDRRLRSAYAEPKSLNADGTADIVVTNSGAQLLLLTDGSGATRGMVVVTADSKAITLNAADTALALLFMSPGVLTTDSREAAERITILRALPTFAAWASFVQNHIPTTLLRDLSGDAEAESLRTTCLEEWQRRSRAWGSDFARFQADFSGTDAIELVSGAWRDAVLLRERLNSNLDLVPEDRPITSPMEGAMPYTWGRLLDAAGFTVSRRYDRPEVSGDPPVGLIRYTVYGPGRSNDATPIPQSLGALEPYAPSVFFAGALPLVDLVYGTSTILVRGWFQARDVMAQAAPDLEISPVRDAVRMGKADEAAAALRPAVARALEGAATIATAYELTGEKKLPTVDSPELVRLAVEGLAPSSFRFLAQTWVDYPEVSIYEVPVTSGEVVVK